MVPTTALLALIVRPSSKSCSAVMALVHGCGKDAWNFEGGEDVWDFDTSLLTSMTIVPILQQVTEEGLGHFRFQVQPLRPGP